MRRVILASVSVWLLFPSRVVRAESEATLWVQGEQNLHFATDAGRRDFSGSVGFSVPWELLLAQRAERPSARGRSEAWAEDDPAPPVAQPAEAEAIPAESQPRATPEELHAAPSRRSAKPSQRSPETAAGDDRGAFPLTPALVRETLARALSAQGTARAEARLASLDSRARWSALLPELRLRAARATDESLRLNPTISDPYRYTRDGGTDVVLEARLSWGLSGLLFSSPEISVERIRLQRAARRDEIRRQVLKALFEWQRARVLAHDAAALAEERQAAALTQLEAELTLNVLTGGWFPRAVVPKAKPPLH